MSHRTRRAAKNPGPSISPAQAFWLAFAALLLGGVGAWLLRGAASASGPPAVGTNPSAPASPSSASDAAVTELLQRVHEHPTDPVLLVDVGNAYYDRHEYRKAIPYYRRSLKVRPTDVDVRTDMGTAMWYSGHPDAAIEQFKTALTYQPDHAQTLYNLGVVEWQGKHDGKSAVEFWRMLLTLHPDYSGRQEIEDMMRQAQQK